MSRKAVLLVQRISQWTS